VAEPGRAAFVYVFAWHPVTDTALADHRIPNQWQFYPVLASALPDQKSIGLRGVQTKARPVSIDAVAVSVRDLLQR
jgi:hypothetical protein